MNLHEAVFRGTGAATPAQHANAPVLVVYVVPIVVGVAVLFAAFFFFSRCRRRRQLGETFERYTVDAEATAEGKVTPASLASTVESPASSPVLVSSTSSPILVSSRDADAWSLDDLPPAYTPSWLSRERFRRLVRQDRLRTYGGEGSPPAVPPVGCEATRSSPLQQDAFSATEVSRS
ncbi:hypothetical protein JCM10212_005501 [Sporobolomyces blumeae]